LLWEYKNSVENLIINFEIYPLYYREDVRKVWDLVIIKDINHDGGSRIAISCESNLILLDGAKGKEFWNINNICINYIWKLKYSDEMIVADSRNGKLVGVNIIVKVQWLFQVSYSIDYYMIFIEYYQNIFYFYEKRTIQHENIAKFIVKKIII
jgi:hypothetical protein